MALPASRRRGEAGKRRQIWDGQGHIAREPVGEEIRAPLTDQPNPGRAQGKVLERKATLSDLGHVEREVGMGA